MNSKNKSDFRYKLYQNSVQDPVYDVPLLVSTYNRVFGQDPKSLREDFCGTFQFACQWVKMGKDHTAVAVDLDREPLDYGRRNNYQKLTSDEKKRIKVLNQNVLTVKNPKVDFIVACNFSFYIFKQRELLVRYLRSCYRSLKKNGMITLEMAGGPGMVSKTKEQRTVYRDNGKKWFVYWWDQKSFNPINHDGFYAIHYQFKNGHWLKNAFTYDWRVWTLPEVRDALRDAGFDETAIFWEVEDRKSKTSELLPCEEGENDWSFISYVSGIRTK